MVLKLLLVSLVAVGMAFFGSSILSVTVLNHVDLDFFYVSILPSLVIWLGLSPLIARCNYFVAAGIGLVSPVFGSLGGFPPLSWLFILHAPQVVFPVGIVTGILVKFVVSTGSSRKR